MKKKPITTPFGQWQYPGAVTRIPSNTITMENVPYPVVGVDDMGVTQMMMPGGGYVFPGSMVTEYPVMGNGGEMIRRADGSYSRRGMWDNIRDNKGSGKKPTKEMLEQERKIRAQQKKKGGSVQDREMVEGVADILRRVKDMENRQQLARYMMNNFADEDVEYDREEFMEDVDLDEMKNGGIPERYKNMGFTKVGVKKQSTSAGKKWMVLAKKGDKYKVVHGGYKGMKDYTQHGSENRRERFWDRMGGRDSAKAKDPFSPLYWHKRFGTWAEGGETYQYGAEIPSALSQYLQRPENINAAERARIEAIRAWAAPDAGTLDPSYIDFQIAGAVASGLSRAAAMQKAIWLPKRPKPSSTRRFIEGFGMGMLNPLQDGGEMYAQYGAQVQFPASLAAYMQRPENIAAAQKRMQQEQTARVKKYATPASGRIEGEGVADVLLPVVAAPLLKAVSKPLANLATDLGQGAMRQFSKPVETATINNLDKVVADLANARYDKMVKYKSHVHDNRTILPFHKSKPLVLDKSVRLPIEKGKPFTLKEEPVFYRTTTPEKFERIMDPISTAGGPLENAENLRFFTPDRRIAQKYMDDNYGNLAISARMNIQKPYFQGPSHLNNAYVQDIIDQGYDAIVTQGHTKKLRDAYEIIPLNKELLYDIQQLEKFQRGGFSKAQYGGQGKVPVFSQPVLNPTLAKYFQKPENIQEAKDRIEDERKGFTYESRVNRVLGNPKRAAAALSEQRQSDVGPVDNVRHSAAGMYTTQAMRDYLMERGVPVGAASTMGVIGSNIAGAAHEVKAFPASLEGDYRNIPAAARMTAEDMFNNLTGSLVGINPFMTQSEREQFLLNASDNNMLPDGYERMPYSKKQAPANMYFKKNGGAFYQDGGPTFDESIRDRVVNAANKIIETNDYYKLSPEKAAVVKANKSNPNELTCIGGVCRVLKEEGVLPEIIESNTDFAQKAEHLGFSKPSFNLSRLKPGDVIQHFGRRNSSGKGYPTHAQMYLGQDEKGNYKFFDNYRGTSQWHGGKGYKTYSESDLKKFLSKGTEGSVDGAQLFHMNPNAERDYVTKEEIAMRESKDASRARRLPVETYKDNLYSGATYESEIVNTQDLPYAYVPKEDASANERELLKLFNNPEFDKKLRETFLVSDQTLEKVKPLIYGVMKQESNFGNPDTAGRSAKYLLENLIGAEKWSTGPAAVRYRDLRDSAKELLGNDSKNLQTIAGAYVGALDSLLTAGSISDSYQMNNPELADKDPWSAALYFYNGQGRSLKRGTTKSGERLQVDAGSYPDKIFQNAASLQRFVPFDANLADPDVYMNPYDVLITPEEQMTAKKELAKGGQPCYTCGGGVMKNGGWADGLVQFLGGGTQYLPKPVNPGESMAINRNYNVSDMKDPLRQNMKTMGAATLNPYMYAMTPENFGAFSGIADIAKAAGALSNVGLGYSKLFNPSRAATFTDASGKQTKYDVMNNRQHDRSLKQYDTPEMMQVAPSVPMFPTMGPSTMQNDPMMAQFGAEVQPTFEEWLQQTGQELMMGSEGMLYKQYQDFLGNNRSQMPVATATPAQTNVSSKTRFSTMGDPQGQALAFGTSAALSSIANNRNYRDMQQLYEQRTQELGNTDNRFDVGFTGYNPFGDYTLNRAQGMNMMPNRTNGVRDSGNNFSYGFGKNAFAMKNGGQYEEGGEYEMNEQELAAFLAAGGQVEYL